MAEKSQTVSTALKLLSCFNSNRSSMSALELSRTLGKSKTSVLRIIASMEEAGFLFKEKSSAKYRIGIAAFEVGTLYLAANPVISVWTTALEELVAKTQYTAYLARLDSGSSVILARREGTLPIRFVWKEGDRLPCETTSLGRAMLSQLSDEEITKHIGETGELRSLTDRPPISRNRLRENLLFAQQHGWAVEEDECHVGVSAIASPILDNTGYPVAAICISFFSPESNQELKEQLASIVSVAAKKATEKTALYSKYEK